MESVTKWKTPNSWCPSYNQPFRLRGSPIFGATHPKNIPTPGHEKFTSRHRVPQFHQETHPCSHPDREGDTSSSWSLEVPWTKCCRLWRWVGKQRSTGDIWWWWVNSLGRWVVEISRPTGTPKMMVVSCSLLLNFWYASRLEVKSHDIPWKVQFDFPSNFKGPISQLSRIFQITCIKLCNLKRETRETYPSRSPSRPHR